MTRLVTDQRGCSGHCVREVAWGCVRCRQHSRAVDCAQTTCPARARDTTGNNRARPRHPTPRLINPQCHKRPPPPPRALRRLHHVWFKIIPTIEFRYRLVLKLPNQLAKYLTIEEDLCAVICTMGNNFGTVERNIPRPCSVEFCTN